MATIATLTPARDGFLQGQLRTLNMSTAISFEPVDSSTEGAPAYRVFADNEVELGAAWAKTAKESGRAYHQVRLDDPSFSAPIYANLIRDEETGGYSLIWNRPRPKSKATRPSRSQDRR